MQLRKMLDFVKDAMKKFVPSSNLSNQKKVFTEQETILQWKGIYPSQRTPGAESRKRCKQVTRNQGEFVLAKQELDHKQMRKTWIK